MITPLSLTEIVFAGMEKMIDGQEKTCLPYCGCNYITLTVVLCLGLWWTSRGESRAFLDE